MSATILAHNELVINPPKFVATGLNADFVTINFEIFAIVADEKGERFYKKRAFTPLEMSRLVPKDTIAFISADSCSMHANDLHSFAVKHIAALALYQESKIANETLDAHSLTGNSNNSSMVAFFDELNDC